MRRRLQLLLRATAVMLPLVVFSSGMVVLFDRQQSQSVEHLLAHAATALENALDRELVANISGLESLATSIHLDDNDLVGFAVAARRLLESERAWLSLRLLRAADGTSLLTLPAGGGAIATAPPAPTREQVLEAVGTGRAVVGELRLAPGDEASVTIVVPVIRNGAAVYALSVALRAAALGEAMRGPRMPEDWFGSVLDRRYVVLARTRRHEEFVGKPATESLRREIENGGDAFFFARNQEGREVYTAFVTSPSTGWTVVVGAPGETVSGPRDRSLMAILGGGALALAATLWLGALLVGNSNRRHAMERKLLELEGERLAERRLAEVTANLPGVIFRRVREEDGPDGGPAGEGRVAYPYLSAGLSGLLDGLAERASDDKPGDPAPGGDKLEALIHPEDRAGWREIFAAEATGAGPRHLEARLVLADGSTRWVRIMARPAAGGGGAAQTPATWDGVMLDVTDLKETQNQLTTSLAESRALLQEVHHRVKNNLQVVWSLIQLETMQIEDDQARERMEIIGQRIGVMGRIHEQVYAAKEFSRVDFGPQLRGLSEAQAAKHRDRTDIALEVSSDPLSCQLDTAIPLGLIANELVSNAYKHAFPASGSGSGRSGGTVRVGLRADPTGALLSVSDDGVGMSGQGQGLGLRLVKGLLGQIGATMAVGPGHGAEPGQADPGGGNRGTRVTITIPGPWYTQ
ncbi:hypothetical protein N825_29670 [Skermanella stibiiresistens SB22]|uniref:histidine kinase n=1 Tax=Skermanella stibiiresistens SB22 TaxID=1385369 RepID=W9GUN6_9PROT|nr:histidine kinase dimerization/phosphoacceptor domain -containing protein [Skermanella stibiiresistens]EWY36127.1 hypothetical protein N825_29670 [Skermanella stibiiresistens SB22]